MSLSKAAKKALRVKYGWKKRAREVETSKVIDSDAALGTYIRKLKSSAFRSLEVGAGRRFACKCAYGVVPLSHIAEVSIDESRRTKYARSTAHLDDPWFDRDWELDGFSFEEGIGEDFEDPQGVTDE